MLSAGPWTVRGTERKHGDLADMLLKTTGTANRLLLGERGGIATEARVVREPAIGQN